MCSYEKIKGKYDGILSVLLFWGGERFRKFCRDHKHNEQKRQENLKEERKKE
jgi:hypothetical protein